MSVPTDAPNAPAQPEGGQQPQGNVDEKSKFIADPEWGFETYNKLKSEGSRLTNELKTFEPIKEVVSQLGSADAVKTHLYEYAAILQDPRVAEVVQHYREHRTLPTTAATQGQEGQTLDSNDEYVDPDVAALRGQLEEMGKMVNDLRGQLSKQTGVIARQSLVSQMSELEQKYAPLGVWDQVKEAILKQESEWNQSPQGRALLADASFDTWDTVAAKAAFSNPDDLRSRLQAARTDTLRSMSTEGGHSIATTGREEPTPRHATVQEALEHMARTGKI